MVNKMKKNKKRSRMLRLPGIVLLAAVFSFQGISAGLPMTGDSAAAYEAYAYIEREEQETKVVPDEFVQTRHQSTVDPIRLFWTVSGAVDGDITDDLGKEQCTLTLDGKDYACSKDPKFNPSEDIIISEPGVYDFTIRFAGDGPKGYRPSEYSGKLTVVEKKELAFTFSLPDTVPAGKPLPLSGTLTDEDGAPMAGVTMCIWVTGAGAFNKEDQYSTVTDENGVWTYSGTILTPVQSGEYYLANMWVLGIDINKYNDLRFIRMHPGGIPFRVSEDAVSDKLDRLEVNAGSVRKTYDCGEAFDTKGLEVKGHFTDSSDGTYDTALTDADYRVIPGKLTGNCESVVIAYSAFGQTKTAVIPVTVNHSWDSGKVTTPASETAEGVRTFTCDRCSAARTEAIPASGESSADPGRASGSSVATTAPKKVTGVRLPKVSVKTVTAGKRSMTVSWAKLTAAKRKKITGIEVQYSLRKSFPQKKSLTRVRIVKKTAKSVKIKKLRSGKTCWVRMRTFKKVNGVKHAGKWSKAKKIKIK